MTESKDVARTVRLINTLSELYPGDATPISKVLQAFYDDAISNEDFTFLMGRSRRGQMLMPSHSYYIPEDHRIN